MAEIAQMMHAELDLAIGKLHGWDILQQPNGCWELTSPDGKPSPYPTGVTALEDFDALALSYTSDGFMPAWSSDWHEAMKLFGQMETAELRADGRLILRGVPDGGYSVFAFDPTYPRTIMLAVCRAWLTDKLAAATRAALDTEGQDG
jgi:hypothetical protein